MGTVFMMDHFVGAPVLQLFQWEAIVLKDLAIDGFELTIRGQDPNETRDIVNCRAQTSLAFTQCFFHPLALGQIEDERNDLVAAFFEQGEADKHRNAAAIFSKILLLEGPNGPG